MYVRSNGKTVPAALADRLEDPEILMYLWDWFWDLSRTRRRNPINGKHEPFSYQELFYWQRVRGHLVTQAEVDLLLQMDRKFIAVMSEEI